MAFFRIVFIGFCIVCGATAALAQRTAPYRITNVVVLINQTSFWSTENVTSGFINVNGGTHQVSVDAGAMSLLGRQYDQTELTLLDISTLTDWATYNSDPKFFPLTSIFIGESEFAYITQNTDLTQRKWYVEREEGNAYFSLPVGNRLYLVEVLLDMTDPGDPKGEGIVTLRVITFEATGDADLFETTETDDPDGYEFDEADLETNEDDEGYSFDVDDVSETDDSADGLEFTEDDVRDTRSDGGLSFDENDFAEIESDEGYSFDADDVVQGDNGDEGLSFDENDLREIEQDEGYSFDVDDVRDDAETGSDEWRRPLTDEQKGVAETELKKVRNCIANGTKCPSYFDEDALRTGYETDPEASEEAVRERITDQLIGPERDERGWKKGFAPEVREEAEQAYDDAQQCMASGSGCPMDYDAQSLTNWYERVGEERGDEWLRDDLIDRVYQDSVQNSSN